MLACADADAAKTDAKHTVAAGERPVSASIFVPIVDRRVIGSLSAIV